MKTMKWIDRWAGLFLCVLLWPIEILLPSRRAPSSMKPRRILVIKFWGMGSIIMAGYLLESLRKAMPEAEITLLTLESNREIAGIIGAADHVETLDISRGPFSVLSNIFSMMIRTFRARYDVVLDLEYLTRFTALVTFASRAPVRVGFYARDFWRGNFHNRKEPFNSYRHVKDNFIHQASAAGFDVEKEPCINLDPGDEGRMEAEKLLKQLGVDGDYIILNPNAGMTSLERRWPVDRFAQLAGRINSELKYPVLVIGAKSEHPVSEGVVKKSGGENIFNVAGQTSVRGLIALMGGSACLVSNDSGPMHMASHAGTKVVGIFGPETPTLWGPVGAKDGNTKTFFRNLDCSPCLNIHNMKTVTCLKEGAECLTEISVDEVFEAFLALTGKVS